MSNEAFGKLGATIVSHEKTKLHLATPVWQPETERYKAALPAAAQPTRSDSGSWRNSAPSAK